MFCFVKVCVFWHPTTFYSDNTIIQFFRQEHAGAHKDPGLQVILQNHEAHHRQLSSHPMDPNTAHILLANKHSYIGCKIETAMLSHHDPFLMLSSEEDKLAYFITLIILT